MRVAIIGAGGIGAVLAARLAAAGGSVAVLARGPHLDTMRADGLRLIEPEGETVVRPDALSDEPAALGVADLVVFAVKAHQLPGAIAQAAPLFGPDTLALPFQNGVEAPQALADAFGADRALIGVAYILSNITVPGVVTRYGGPGSFVVGNIDGTQGGAAGRVRALFEAAGIASPDSDDVRVTLWTKFLMFAAMSGTTAAARTRLGVVRDTPALWRVFEALVAETDAVARARGIALADDAVEKVIAQARKLPDSARASTAHDLEAGKPLEIDWTIGALARLGRQSGVAVPVAETIEGVLAPWAGGVPG